MRPLVLAIFLAAAAAAPAQSLEGLTPVDQAVGDIDPLSISQRRFSRGLWEYGEHTSLFTPMVWPGREHENSPISQRGGRPYYRVGPGFRARVDRLDYLVRLGTGGFAFNLGPRVDGEFLEFAPANLVWELGPVVAPPPAPLGDETVRGRIDTRVETRVDRRVEPIPVSRRIDTRIDTQVGGPAPPE